MPKSGRLESDAGMGTIAEGFAGAAAAAAEPTCSNFSRAHGTLQRGRVYVGRIAEFSTEARIFPLMGMSNGPPKALFQLAAI